MQENIEPDNARRQELRQALEEAIANPEEPIIGYSIRDGLRTSAKPVRVRAMDGNEYMVKGRQAGRAIINDQVVARLGKAMNAPVGDPCLIEISQNMIDHAPEFDYLATGIAHATRYMPNCMDDRDFLFINANRSRFAYLAVLYGWMYASDQQFIYENQAPHLVHSVDHGHFFVGSPDWEARHLHGRENAAKPDPMIVRNCKLTNKDLCLALAALEGISEQTILQVVGNVPEEWGINIDERLALVEYLVNRQHDLLEIFQMMC